MGVGTIFTPFRLMLLGIILVVLGFIYDVMFAGIPYQDPTPELQTRWEIHSKIASVIQIFALLLFLAGLSGIAYRKIKCNKSD